jgi:hypothetical protein
MTGSLYLDQQGRPSSGTICDLSYKVRTALGPRRSVGDQERDLGSHFDRATSLLQHGLEPLLNALQHIRLSKHSALILHIHHLMNSIKIELDCQYYAELAAFCGIFINC